MKYSIQHCLLLVLSLPVLGGCGADQSTEPAADYTLSLTPASITIVQGSSANATVNISRSSFDGAVTLSVADAPAGIVASFDPATAAGNTATFKVTIGPAMALGNYTLTVHGSASVGNRTTPLTVTVNLPSGNVASVAAGSAHSCAVTTSGVAYCWGGYPLGGSSNRPLPVAGGLTFTAVSGIWNHNCGVTQTGDGYCWGNYNGFQPTLVAGGLKFATISAGYAHTCGVTTTGVAYCWGANEYAGVLGNGTSFGSSSLVPTAVAGGLTFVMVSAGIELTCGVTTDGTGYCWGVNYYGALGDGTTTPRLVPTPVAGGLTFATVSAGGSWACGVTRGGALYCWGVGGSLGDGSYTNRLVPTRIAEGLVFATVSANYVHTCGVTMSGAAYCWGNNYYGQLGDGTTTDRLFPTAVAGGLTFATVSTGSGWPVDEHTCGVSTGGALYCWGSNFAGELGDGTTTQHLVPTLVNFP